MRQWGDLLHSSVQQRAQRSQSHDTFFLRNRPELRLLSALLNQKANTSTVKLTVLACSNGAEVYSILWATRSERPYLRITTEAIDISDSIVEVAKRGKYSMTGSELINTQIFERLTSEEIETIFDRENDSVTVKPWLRAGINWRVADASAPGLATLLGPQDIVVANRFLCHMNSIEAERCLRNIGKLVLPGGYLFVSGVDLDVRSKVALESGWQPVSDLIEEIHDGDPSVREGWPCNYWGLEPFDKSRKDWRIRYASVFQIGAEIAATRDRS